MGKLKAFFITLFSLAFLSLAISFSMKNTQEHFMGILYEDYDDRSQQEYKEGFDTLEDCQNWAYELAEEKELANGSWDYECGIGCKIEDTGLNTRNWDRSDVTRGNLFQEFNDRIRNLSITDGDTITSNMTITGEAQNMFFEGSFPVTVVGTSDDVYEVLYNGLATSEESWMNEGFIPFSIEIEFLDTQGHTDGLIIFENSNPSGLDEYDYSYAVEVQF